MYVFNSETKAGVGRRGGVSGMDFASALLPAATPSGEDNHR